MGQLVTRKTLSLSTEKSFNITRDRKSKLCVDCSKALKSKYNPGAAALFENVFHLLCDPQDLKTDSKRGLEN